MDNQSSEVINCEVWIDYLQDSGNIVNVAQTTHLKNVQMISTQVA